MEGGGGDSDASLVEQSRPGKGRLHGDDGQRGILKALGHKGKDLKGRFFVVKDNFMHYFKNEQCTSASCIERGSSSRSMLALDRSPSAPGSSPVPVARGLRALPGPAKRVRVTARRFGSAH